MTNGNFSLNLTITLPTDDDGMLGRQCPREICRPRYFKMLAQTELAAGWCPYCTHYDAPQAFCTPDQIAYAQSIALRELMQMLQRELQMLERHPDPQAFFSLGITVQTGALPMIAEYAEEHLKRVVTCGHCQQPYAIYGISHVCPYCGQATLLQHLEDDVSILQGTLQLAEQSDLSAVVRQHIIENGLGDVVSLWEGYLKALYLYAVQRATSAEDIERIKRGLRTTFQRIDGAQDRFKADLDVPLLAHLTPEEVTMLRSVFEKRHLFTHNLGVADERYQGQHRQGRIGQEIETTIIEVNQALMIVQKVLQCAHLQIVGQR